jgi:hypothetical protein
MAHPVHDLLRRFLGTEQFAFDAGSRQFWPLDQGSRLSPVAVSAEPDDEEPTQFDDVYPWLEPEA